MTVYVCLIFNFNISSNCIRLKTFLCPYFQPYFGSCAQSKKVYYKCKQRTSLCKKIKKNKYQFN